MARIKFNDLPRDMKISKEEMKKITGGSLSYSQLAFDADASSALDAPLSPLGGGDATKDGTAKTGEKPSSAAPAVGGGTISGDKLRDTLY